MLVPGRARECMSYVHIIARVHIMTYAVLLTMHSHISRIVYCICAYPYVVSSTIYMYICVCVCVCIHDVYMYTYTCIAVILQVGALSRELCL